MWINTKTVFALWQRPFSYFIGISVDSKYCIAGLVWFSWKGVETPARRVRFFPYIKWEICDFFIRFPEIGGNKRDQFAHTLADGIMWGPATLRGSAPAHTPPTTRQPSIIRVLQFFRVIVNWSDLFRFQASKYIVLYFLVADCGPSDQSTHFFGSPEIKFGRWGRLDHN